MQTAFFSILSPGMHILAHRGPYKDVIRCHLVLIVPEPNCRIRVADTIAHREEGKTMFFNDTYEHEVWNGTEGVIKAIAASPFITDAKRNHEAWEQRMADLWR